MSDPFTDCRNPPRDKCIWCNGSGEFPKGKKCHICNGKGWN